MLLPQVGSVAQTTTLAFPGEATIDLGLAINQPPPCLTGFVPASQWRSPADTSLAPLPSGTYCKIPQETPGNAVRGARNIPCIDVAGRRAASPQDCRSGKPYVPEGTNPWYGDPNQILTCPAPAARCDQPVKPGHGDPSADAGHRAEPGARRSAAGHAPAGQRPLVTAGIGHRAVQRTAAQPVCLHTGRAAQRNLGHPKRRDHRTRRREVLRAELERHRRRRMEEDAGANRLTLPGAADSSAVVAVSDPAGPKTGADMLAPRHLPRLLRRTPRMPARARPTHLNPPTPRSQDWPPPTAARRA